MTTKKQRDQALWFRTRDANAHAAEDTWADDGSWAAKARAATDLTLRDARGRLTADRKTPQKK